MNTLKLFNRIKTLPRGTQLFSFVTCRMAPYFGSIKPHIVRLEPGYCEVHMKKRRAVTNHLKTVHAIAMCNAAELAGGMMTDVSISKDARWIPKGMTVSYVKKARTDLRAVAQGEGIDWTISGDIKVPVELLDTNDEVVFTADITMNVKPSD